MVGGILLGIGIVLMLTGALTLAAWEGGKSKWFDPEVFDRPGNTINDRQYLNLYFLFRVVVPLLGGGILIVYGLRKLLH